MRTTHTFTATRALLLSGALLIVASLVFAFAPLSQVAAARQALAARAQANPTIGKIIFPRTRAHPARSFHEQHGGSGGQCHDDGCRHLA